MKKIALLKVAAVLFCGVAAQAQVPELVPVSNINTSYSPVIQSDSTNNPIYTVNGQGNDSGKIFRRPPNSPYSTQGPYGCPLIYVASGGLESDSGTYSFPLIAALNGEYTPMSFSFSGTASSLVFYSGTGWGTVNTAGGFMPYLLRNDYQRENRPYYEFYWSPKETFSTKERTTQSRKDKSSTKDSITTQTNPNITLNYVFKVPAQSEIKWGTENSFTRFTFAGGPQISESMQTDKVYKWAQGSIGSVDAISNISTPSSWQIPQNLDSPSGFAVANDGNLVVAAAQGGNLVAFQQDGTVKWQTSGASPLIACGSSGLFSMSADYRSLQYIDTASGRVLASYRTAPYLPREDNTLAIAACSGGKYLFLQVPAQSSIYVFRIK